MKSLLHFISPPSACSYLPWESASIEYELVTSLSADEYMKRMLNGWRRFGAMLFRPRCPECTGCRALRVDVACFYPTRSQRRCRKVNEGDVRLIIARPSVTQNKLDLYDRYHAHQAVTKGWPAHPPKDAADYRESYVNNPAFTEEWRYLVGNDLIGVGYVDALPGGLSAIYYFHDPVLRHRSLGTWNVLCVLDEARRRELPWAYLGYYVEGCGSLEYKAKFRPNQLRLPDGSWNEFLD